MLSKHCHHVLLSLTRSGANISAYCAKCGEKVLNSDELTIWRYGLRNSHSNCEGRIIRIARSGSEIKAECLTCGQAIAKKHDLKIQKQSILSPNVDLEPLRWRV